MKVVGWNGAVGWNVGGGVECRRLGGLSVVRWK